MFRIENERAVLFDVEEGEPYILNESATEIWQLFDGKTELESIATTLFQVYDEDEEAIRNEFLAFVESLVEKEFLQLT
ncbi:MAG: PqqD family protein [bacterium]